MPTHYKGTTEERRALDVFIKLMRAAQSVAERTSGPMDAAGLTWSQFGVLETLYHLGPQMCSQLAQKHLKSANNITVVLDNLEKQKLCALITLPVFIAAMRFRYLPYAEPHPFPMLNRDQATVSRARQFPNLADFPCRNKLV